MWAWGRTGKGFGIGEKDVKGFEDLLLMPCAYMEGLYPKSIKIIQLTSHVNLFLLSRTVCNNAQERAQTIKNSDKSCYENRATPRHSMGHQLYLSVGGC